MYADFSFDEMLDSKDIENMLSEEEAVEAVKTYLYETYEEGGWEKIEALAGDCGIFGSCWTVTCTKEVNGITVGYIVAADVITGEVKFVDQMK
ncbi:MAG: hypothetical protein NC223_05865 [Butyrivibrio sp.]|nr:hypothetical protein [Butyrivibrio sp.]